jgi:hypothetical protein
VGITVIGPANIMKQVKENQTPFHVASLGDSDASMFKCGQEFQDSEDFLLRFA